MYNYYVDPDTYLPRCAHNNYAAAPRRALHSTIKVKSQDDVGSFNYLLGRWYLCGAFHLSSAIGARGIRWCVTEMRKHVLIKAGTCKLLKAKHAS